MENIYEKMWKDNKKWFDSSLIYYTNLLQSYSPDVNPDFHRVANLQGMFQFLVDKLNRDEKINAEKIEEYENRSD
ncbi:hypothetical protein [Bacillus sp. FJAT-22090]|uniref:hypothetical protein n=1 Tax=Bacillus sp. FJAT-22090 TaxID=1581038 RepID=UPI0011A4A26D|nr:hypothetical protein [Bacillus sp. FJAT-22090]